MYQIRHKVTGKVIHEHGTTPRECAEDAVKRGISLEGADLRGADLRGADLRGANLRGADLRRADLPPHRVTLPKDTHGIHFFSTKEEAERW